jgi:prepilin-type N-terminal cleavage/methylation domain-containing protein
MRHAPRSAGFTLLEVMTTVAIVSLVLVMVYSCWSAVLNATESSNVAAQNSHRERMTLQTLDEVFSGVAWYEHHTNGPFHLDSAGAFSQLSIISRVPPDFWGARHLGAHPLRRIEFRAEPTADGAHQLVMIQQPLLSVPNGSPKIHRTVLLPRVETFALEVREDTRPITPWEPNWNGANGLPADARVSLGMSADFPRHQSWPLLAHLAQHAKPPPGIGNVTNLSGSAFSDGGFDTGEQDSGARLVFIIDKSGSMWGGQLNMAKNALLKSLYTMNGEGQFYAYFFNQRDDAMRINDVRAPIMLDSNSANIAKVSEWIESRRAWGGTDPSDSLKSAFTHKPTELYLLTDGEFRGRKDEPTIRELIQSLNANKATKINTLAIGDSLRGTPAEASLMIIAQENGGTYTFIDPATVKSPPKPAGNP